jgi:hypothetical protein
LNPEDWNVQQFSLYAKSSRPIRIPEYEHILTTAKKLLTVVLTAPFHASQTQNAVAQLPLPLTEK